MKKYCLLLIAALVTGCVSGGVLNIDVKKDGYLMNGKLMELAAVETSIHNSSAKLLEICVYEDATAEDVSALMQLTETRAFYKVIMTAQEQCESAD